MLTSDDASRSTERARAVRAVEQAHTRVLVRTSLMPTAAPIAPTLGDFVYARRVLAYQRVLFACALCCAILFASPRLYAQNDEGTGDDAFARGFSALRAGRHDEAAAAFALAWKRDKNPRALINLGIACTREGRVQEAIDAFRRYAAVADPQNDVQNLQLVRGEIARLERESTRIHLRVSPAHAVLRVDGRKQVVHEGQIRVAPGRHRVKVSAKGHRFYEQTVDLPAGDVTLALVLRPKAARATRQTAAFAPQPTAARQKQAAPPTVARETPAGPCALGQVCLGPIIGFGLPNLVGGGLHVRLGDYFGAALDYQVLPSITLDPATASASLFTVSARIHPFGGALFVAGGFGYQSIEGRVDSGLVAAEASVDVPALVLGLGLAGRDGLVLGVDLALLLPLRGRSVVVRDLSEAPMGVPQSEIDRVQRQSKDGVEKVLDLLPVLLQLNLVRVGYLF